MPQISENSDSPSTVEEPPDLPGDPRAKESTTKPDLTAESIKLQAQANELKLSVGMIALEQQKLSVEQQKLKLEQQKLSLERQHLTLASKESERSAWRHPIFLATVAATVGLLGNAVTGVVNGRSQHNLEEQKAESQRIESALRTGLDNPDKAAENLSFLADVGLLDFHAKGIRDYLAQRRTGHGPSLSLPTPDHSGNTPLYYSCNSDSECIAGSMCIDYNHDRHFYCKPLCTKDADCAGNKYGETLCGVLGKNGNLTASGKHFCLAPNDPNGDWSVH